MILTCPSCSSRFLVDDAMIPEEGRHVRCASCAHQWFVRPEGDMAELKPSKDAAPAGDQTAEYNATEEESSEQIVRFDSDDSDTTDVADEIDLDIPDIDFGTSIADNNDDQSGPLVSTRPLKMAAGFLLLALVVAAFFTFRTALQPSLGFLYNTFGIYTVDGLVLADVELRERPSKSKARYVVEGKIINEASEPRHIPVLRVVIISKDGDVMMKREYEADADNSMLQPGESYPFKAGRLETTFKDRVDHLLIDIGSGTELMLRGTP